MTSTEYNQSVELYADRLYRFAKSRCNDGMLAEDVVQESFEKAWKSRDSIQFETLKSWLFKVANNLIVDHYRKSKYSTDLKAVDVDDSFGVANEYSDLQTVLHEALQKLPAIQKTLVLLRDYEGYDYKEIGKITDLNESQVKVYIFRARKTLKSYLGKIESII